MNKLFRKSLLLALLPMIGFALFYIIPYLFVVRYSVNSENGIGFEYFRSVFTNEYFRLALKNTAFFIMVSIPIMLVLGYLFTEIAVHNRSGGLFSIVLFLPALIPSVSASNIWRELFQSESVFPIIVLFIWKNVGIITLIMTAGRMRISREIFDAASIDGAGFYTLHSAVILPLMTPVIFFSALVGLVQSFKIFREIYLMYSAYPPEELYMIPHYIFNKFNKLDYGELSAGTLIFALMIVVIIAACGLGVMIYTKGRRGNR